MTREERKEYNKIYYAANKKRMNRQMVMNITERRKSDPLFRLQTNISNRIRETMRKRKHKTTCNILGCSYEQFKEYIQSKWHDWMSWDNYGKYNGENNFGWDLDHIIPISQANSLEEVEVLNHYTNFQPLCSKENRVSKRNKFT